MEIRPGTGLELVRLGESRAEVEARIGVPDSAQGKRTFYDNLTPALVIEYGHDGVVELIEVAYAGVPEHEVTLNEVQLTYRPIDAVLADLAAAGFSSRESDIGFDFPDGFAIWSMGSLWLPDVDSSADPDDERQVVEGVSVAAPSYFGF